MQNAGSVAVADRIASCLLHCWQPILDVPADREPVMDRPLRRRMASVRRPVRLPCFAGRKRRGRRSQTPCVQMGRSCRRSRLAADEKSAEPIGDRNHRDRRAQSSYRLRCASRHADFGRKRRRWQERRSVARKTARSLVVLRTWRRRFASAWGIRRGYHRNHRAGG